MTIRKFVSNLVNPVQILSPKQAYALWAPTYDETDNNAILLTEEQLLLPIFDRIQLENKRVIDFGCGTGRHVAHYLDRNAYEILGIDISESMLSVARRKTTDPKVHFIQSGLDAIPITNAIFDVGIASLVLSHLEELGPSLKEMARVLRSGASLLVADVHWSFNERGWQRIFRSQTAPKRRFAPESYYHTLVDFQKAFDENGFMMVIHEEPVLSPAVRGCFERSNMMHVYNHYLGKPLLVYFEATKK
jgi:malonyl-CoA O-methyltransferase